MELSKRLQTIAHMVSEGNRLVDIGTDHGYIPIYLLQNKKIPYAIAMDVGTGPLQRAKEHIKAYCLEDQAICRLSNGFEQYRRGEADTAVIAGMGGDLMAKLLVEGLEKLPSELVLQPQSEWHKVRRFLMENDYLIVQESMVVEDGKYYVILKAKKDQSKVQLSETELLYGPVLLRKQDPVLKDYLIYSRRVKNQIFEKLTDAGTESAIQRKQEIELQMKQIKGALDYYEK